MTLFELTTDHLKLLQRARVTWNTSETGAPTIDPNRPYGDRDVYGDVRDILGLVDPIIEDYDRGLLSHLSDDAILDLHKETETALQIILQLQTFEPGLFGDRGYLDVYEWVRLR